MRGTEEAGRALVEELHSLPGNPPRSHYTRRILDITRNMEKQRKDIANILADTRGVQVAGPCLRRAPRFRCGGCTPWGATAQVSRHRRPLHPPAPHAPRPAPARGVQ